MSTGESRATAAHAASVPGMAGHVDRGGDLRGVLAIEDVSFRYGSRRGRDVSVLDEVTFTVPAGSVACVVGPSGCGKSTLLSLAAGLLAPSGGQLRWDGEPIELGPNREMAMAFQQPGLFPWMTVVRNVTVGLETRGVPKREALALADEILERVGLHGFKHAYPSQLSGGMAQRVGIARALVLKPRLLLLDEPFASVDAFTRLKLQEEFKGLLKLDPPTVLFVTHDVPEAIAVGDMVVTLSDRPATVQNLMPIEPADRQRGSSAYSRKLAEILESLGVTTDSDKF
jgi:NitT/TauT family transport system ATP-binding protein